MVYYTKLLGLWEELLTLSPTIDAPWFDKLKTYQFLMGLDDSYHTIRSNIINTNPLPVIDNVYSMVVQEESHKNIANEHTEAPALGFHAMNDRLAPIKPAFISGTSGSKPGQPADRTAMGRPWCTHCNRVGHLEERCYLKLGISPPSRGQGRNQRRGTPNTRGSSVSGQATAAAVSGVTLPCAPSAADGQMPHPLPGFSTEQMQRLVALLEPLPSTLESLVGKTPSLVIPWLIDSGASHHMTGCLDVFSTIRNNTPSLVGLPDGLQTNAVKEGSVSLAHRFTLRNVLYVPNFAVNLIFVIFVAWLIHDVDCFVTFTDNLCILQDRTTRNPIGLGKMQRGVYLFQPVPEASIVAVTRTDQYTIWHRRMGHASHGSLSSISGIQLGSKPNNKLCDVCCRAKQTRDMFSRSSSVVLDLFDLIHCDIWGPYHTSTHSGARYFFTIVDEFSRATWVYLMQQKSQASDLLKIFCKMTQTQYHKPIKVVRSDNGLEFTSKTMLLYYSENGLLHQTSMVKTPQQNARVERKHCHILEVARALRFQAHLPIEYWGECVLVATHLINHTPTPILQNKTPIEILSSKPPSYTHIRVFSCLCYAHVQTSDKFASRSIKCVFIGYPQGKKGWKILDLETHTIFTSRDVKFDETKFPFSTIGSPPLDDAAFDNTSLFDSPLIPIGGVDQDPVLTTGSASGSSSGTASLSLDSDPPATGPTVPPTPFVTVLPTPEQPATGQPGLPQPAQPVIELGYGKRSKRPPSAFQDYHCHTARLLPPLASFTPVRGSSGPRYPLANYVSYASFSAAHAKFLNAVTARVEPRSFSMAMSEPNWRAAMGSNES